MKKMCIRETFEAYNIDNKPSNMLEAREGILKTTSPMFISCDHPESTCISSLET
jgi:hypothetical protein